MKKNKVHWWIDIVLLAVFWISFFPDLTGLEIHEGLGIAAIMLTGLHLMLHWKWVETVTLRFFSQTSSQARTFYMIDLGILLGFFMILITGLMISTWLDLPLYDFAAWTRIHLMVSIFTLLMVVLKLILHWRWISAAARRYVFASVFRGTGPGVSNSPVRPVERRDFLKVAGILGAAAFVTVHSLVEDTYEAQAQSNLPEALPLQTSATTEASALPADPVDVASDSPAETPFVSTATAEPTIACLVRCPNGCAYPGRCRKYVDLNGNNLCDNGECL